MQAKFRPATLAASVALAAVLASGAALAQVDVSNAWVRGTVPTQTASGAFMVLHAHDDAKLVGVSSPVAVAELHEMKMEGNVMRMRQVKSLDLPRMQDVELKPGGYHVMLMGLKSQLKKGDTVPITLKIEQGGKVIEQKVTAEVRDMVPTAASGGHAGHGDHKH
jgi:copper(I)-binding protein